MKKSARKSEIIRRALASCNVCDAEIKTPNAAGYCDDCTENAGCDRCGMFDRMPNSKFCEGCAGRGE